MKQRKYHTFVDFVHVTVILLKNGDFEPSWPHAQIFDRD